MLGEPYRIERDPTRYSMKYSFLLKPGKFSRIEFPPHGETLRLCNLPALVDEKEVPEDPSFECLTAYFILTTTGENSPKEKCWADASGVSGMTRARLFHLAIPSADLAASRAFYEALGCRMARSYDDRITLDFFGDQVVCHLDPAAIDPNPKMYPRHFGVTFRDEPEFVAVLERARKAGLRFFAEPALRFDGKRERHRTFFLIDPSNNLLEFKWYADPEMMY
jgi:extradiol dioxygenase family protein